MTANQTKGLLSSLAALVLLAEPAAAGPVIDIMGRVATVCRVSLTGGAMPVEPGEQMLGRLTELCNNVDGYRLVLLHPAGLEDAYVVLDGERIAIAADSTRTVIVDSNRPAYRERDLTLVLAEGAEAVAVNIEAQPKGMIF
ncbi:hypothetical protein HMPREF0185_00108 [Brevundimonas diminuta 470-4]|uniref:hypothetical protein n=1 Tax=Brevundimonas naejangsanensis TaxID=588932 RepID=UPI0002A46865|nr:hypothetical protein [Brevundimonas naejangsanensis]EKY30788.1 hypothetical protein HMPREF0185_00108 [Brevundimonas diminuta 470-4]